MSDLAPNPEPVISDEQWERDGKVAAERFRKARIDDNRFVLDETDGIREVLHFDGDTVSLERVQDVESVLEWCKGRYNEGLANKHCEFRHVASIPTTVIDLYAKLYLGPQAQWSDLLKRENDGLFKQMLNDRDLSGFRSLGGVV